MRQNYHFVVMLSQMFLRVSAHQRHHEGAHTDVVNRWWKQWTVEQFTASTDG
jgi:hypothetical protein